MGALEDATTAYIPAAQEELERLFEDTTLKENWSCASNMYDRQFDHPYDYAYQIAISEMEGAKKKVFYEMALKGTNRSFFATSILIDTTLHLEEAVCPLIEKWLENPIYDQTMPQDSIKIFLLSHLIYAKYSYPIISRFADAADSLDKSLFAAAEIYYWINRSDLSEKKRKELARPAAVVLFAPDNEYLIDTIYESRHNISSSQTKRLWDDALLAHIEHYFADACLRACRVTLKRLDWQKEVLEFQGGGGGEVDRHAVYLLERLGGIVDLDVLRRLTEHALLGRSAVEAIKVLTRKS